MSPERARPRAIAAPGLAATALLAACAGTGPSGAEETTVQHAFETVLAQAHSGIAERRREVIHDEETWGRLWAEIHAGAVPAPPRPAVDFARDMLILVASGTRSSGGYSIKVRSVATRGGRLEVSVLETCPARGAMVTLALTQPVEVVRVPKLPLAPTFQDARADSCG